MQGVGELLNVPSMSICKGHALGQQAQVYGAPQQLPPELCASGSAQPPPSPAPAPSGGMLHRESLPEIQEQQVTCVPVLRAGFPN